MAEIVTTLGTAPGIQRDGTNLDSSRYQDGKWVRFQRGRPKKMGGYRQIVDNVNGPVRGTQIWSRQGTNLITCFSAYGVEEISVNSDFIGASITNRTPVSGWVDNTNYLWQFATLYDSAAGSDKTLLFAHPGVNLTDIDSGEETDVYYGDTANSAALVAIGTDLQVSGGIVAIAPYLVGYGSDGLVKWSNENEPRNYTTGDSGQARITDKKVVKGLPIRGSGQSPSALLWSIDSVFKMSYIGGQAVFKFDSITSESSILSTNGVVEFDGEYYWAGIDRFLMYDGRVKEVPNDQNVNWFYDNLNFDQRQKVHAVKVPRFGEIWWFFPVDDETECSKAVIYNVREKYWYDVELPRASGSSSTIVRHPVLADAEANLSTLRVSLTGVTDFFLVGDTVSGGTSFATGVVAKTLGDDIYLKDVVGTFVAAETVTGDNGSGTIDALADIDLYSVWLHESGMNKVVGDNELSIHSYIETDDFSFLTGGPDHTGAPKNVHTRIMHVEPDFIASGDLSMVVTGETTAQGATVDSSPFTITENTEIVDLGEQRRIMRLRFSSDCLNGNYELGKVIVHVEEGDPNI